VECVYMCDATPRGGGEGGTVSGGGGGGVLGAATQDQAKALQVWMACACAASDDERATPLRRRPSSLAAHT
jgi:hypothetical protein